MRCGGQTLARLTEIWSESGPGAHPYAALYYREAQSLARTAVSLMASLPGALRQPAWEVTLTNGSVYFKPDFVELQAAGAKAAAYRFRAGRPPHNEPEDPLYGLYLKALQDDAPEAEPSLRIAYLATGETRELTLSPRKIQNRLAKYDTAMENIRQQNFAPQPDSAKCPSCVNYFICPSGA